MRGREKTGIVGSDGHFCAVVARLVKHPVLERHEYIRILFESRVEIPIVALGLQGGAVKPFGNLSPVQLSMGGLMFIKHSSGSGMSRAEELGAYPARRTIHRISFPVLDA